MGYETKMVTSSLKIKSEDKEKIFHIWRDLNHPSNNHLKCGGRGETINGKHVRTAHWYSWMDENYDKNCQSVEDILKELSFGVYTLKNGDLEITHFNGGEGQEELFFERVRPYIQGKASWEREDGSTYEWKFN